MAQQTVNNGDSGLSARDKINENFTELYDIKADKNLVYDTVDMSAVSNYTAVQADNNKGKLLSKATAITFTLPILEAGTQFIVRRTGVGALTFVADGTTITTTKGDLTDPGLNLATFVSYKSTTEVFLDNGVSSGAGSGDVVGPASATNNNFAAFDTTTGKLIKDSGSSASTFQAADSDLADIAALTPSNDDFLQRKAGAWTNRTIAQVQSDLGVGGASFRTKVHKNNSGLSLTGSTSETVADFVLIPAGTFQANDNINFEAYAGKTGTAGTCNQRLRVGPNLPTVGAAIPSGTTVLCNHNPSATNVWVPLKRTMVFRNSLASQFIYGVGVNAANDLSITTTAGSSLTLDFTVDQYIVYTQQLANSADTIVTHSWWVEIIR